MKITRAVLNGPGIIQLKRPAVGMTIAAATSLVYACHDTAIQLIKSYGTIGLTAAAVFLYSANLAIDYLKDKRSFIQERLAPYQAKVDKLRAEITTTINKAIADYKHEDGFDYERTILLAEVFQAVKKGDITSQPDQLLSNITRWESQLKNVAKKLIAALRLEPNQFTRFQAAYDLINKQPYNLRNGDLFSLLETGQGNCYSRTKLLLSLGECIYPRTEIGQWRLAVAVYEDHIEPVLFSRHTNQVFCPTKRTIAEPFHAPVYDPRYLLFSTQEGAAQKTELRKPDPLPRPLHSTWKDLLMDAVRSHFATSSLSLGKISHQLPRYQPDSLHSIRATIDSVRRIQNNQQSEFLLGRWEARLLATGALLFLHHHADLISSDFADSAAEYGQTVGSCSETGSHFVIFEKEENNSDRSNGFVFSSCPPSETSFLFSSNQARLKAFTEQTNRELASHREAVKQAQALLETDPAEALIVSQELTNTLFKYDQLFKYFFEHDKDRYLSANFQSLAKATSRHDLLVVRKEATHSLFGTSAGAARINELTNEKLTILLNVAFSQEDFTEALDLLSNLISISTPTETNNHKPVQASTTNPVYRSSPIVIDLLSAQEMAAIETAIQAQNKNNFLAAAKVIENVLVKNSVGNQSLREYLSESQLTENIYANMNLLKPLVGLMRTAFTNPYAKELLKPETYNSWALILNNLAQPSQ
ncbi:MAG: hypothetical protein ABIH56_06445 [Candidatus Margulisiibacteriota bacterium]